MRLAEDGLYKKAASSYRPLYHQRRFAQARGQYDPAVRAVILFKGYDFFPSASQALARADWPGKYASASAAYSGWSASMTGAV